MKSSSRVSRPLGARGFTLTELIIVVAILGILAALAIPLYGSFQHRARIAKARADTRALASAVVMYLTHCGVLPDYSTAGTDCTAGAPGSGILVDSHALTRPQTNFLGQVTGPFMVAVPMLPDGMARYTLAVNASGVFVVSGVADGVTISAP